MSESLQLRSERVRRGFDQQTLIANCNFVDEFIGDWALVECSGCGRGDWAND